MEIKASFRCGVLSVNDHSTIAAYEREHLTDKSICMRSSHEEIDRCLRSGCSIGFFIDDMLVGYTLANFTDFTIGYIEKCFVLPTYRGQQIQRSSMMHAMGLLVEHRAIEIYTMVAPENKVSISNFEAVGFKLRRTVEYDGHERNIMVWSAL